MRIFSKIVLYIFIIGFLMPIKLFPQVPSLSDLKDRRTPQDETVSIAIILDEIRQGIQFKNAENITRHLYKDFTEPGQVWLIEANEDFICTVSFSVIKRVLNYLPT